MRCIRCHGRFAQHNGLCRRCERYIAEMWARAQSDGRREPRRHVELRPVTHALRTVVIDGQEFEVVWDGSVAGKRMEAR
jgi:hypothetical protein